MGQKQQAALRCSLHRCRTSCAAHHLPGGTGRVSQRVTRSRNEGRGD